MTFSARAIAAVAFLVLLGIGALSLRSTVREEEDRSWVTHTHVVLEAIDTLLLDTSQTESAARGYLLTGEDLFLTPYHAAELRLRHEVTALRDLTADNPDQQQLVDRLNILLTKRLELLRERMETRQQKGLVAAAAEVANGNNGEQSMVRIRDVVRQMRETEQRLLTQRLDAAADSTFRMKAVILGGNAMAFLILLVTAALIFHETGRRNAAEECLSDANRRLEKQKQELSDANAELESFSYSVAHDLRAPLRQIAGYSKVLLQERSESIDTETQRYLEKISEGAAKMGHLVDDLLGLSKIGRQELLVQETSLDKLVAQVVEELQPERSERTVEWQIGELFSTDCDPGLMKQVFVNLLSNAVKYTRKKNHAVIQVGFLLQDGERVIFLRDNGAGFDMQYAHKLFGVFQRLHKAREFEGTGVGLAITSRIIRKHGGRIWAEAKVDQGATFFFTLGEPDDHLTGGINTPANGEVIHVA